MSDHKYQAIIYFTINGATYHHAESSRCMNESDMAVSAIYYILGSLYWRDIKIEKETIDHLKGRLDEFREENE